MLSEKTKNLDQLLLAEARRAHFTPLITSGVIPLQDDFFLLLLLRASAAFFASARISSSFFF